MILCTTLNDGSFESLTYQGTICAEYFRICFLLPCQDCVRANPQSPGNEVKWPATQSRSQSLLRQALGTRLPATILVPRVPFVLARHSSKWFTDVHTFLRWRRCAIGTLSYVKMAEVRRNCEYLLDEDNELRRNYEHRLDEDSSCVTFCLVTSCITGSSLHCQTES